MVKLTMAELKLQLNEVLEKAMSGQRFVVTCKGRPVMTLEPTEETRITEDDPIYRLADLADTAPQPMSNGQIDQTVYTERAL